MWQARVMARSGAQFTAAQILEAGRRAEAEGRAEQAVQFYRHLADHYPQAAEAPFAWDGLSRLGYGGTNGYGHPPPQAAPPHADPGSRPHTGLALAPAGARRVPTRLPMPADANAHRMGRAVAVLVGVIGWLGVGAGLLVFAILASGRFVSAPVAGTDVQDVSVLLGASGGATFLVGGLVLVLIAHAARAVFEGANAAATLVAIERARAGEE